MKNPLRLLTGAPSPAARAAATLRRDLDAAREATAAAKAEIGRLESAPSDIETALAAFDAWADRAIQAAIDTLPIARLTDPRSAHLGLDIGAYARPGQPADATPTAKAAMGLAVLAMRDRLRQAVADQLSDLIGDAGMTADQRAAALAAAHRALTAAEAAEELAVRDLERAGLPVQRRPDADPRAVLATDQRLAQLADAGA